MSLLSTDNRDLVEIEAELRARIDAQRRALETLRGDVLRLEQENQSLRDLLEARHSAQSYRAEPALAHLSPVVAEAC